MSVSKPHRKRASAPASRASDGFTLLEALIAITILALSLSALLSLYSTGLRGVASIDDHMRARLLAQSVMAELSYDRGLRPGRVQGHSDPFTWSLTVTPFEEAEPSRQSTPWSLHHLAVTVSWPHGRQIELQTLRMLRTQ